MTTERHSIWSITINNPTSADEEEIARARQKGWKVEGQLEKGENGTAHYQLMVSTGQVRFSAVKKAFTRAHIEPARNPQALKQYVEKEDTRIGELATANEFYPSLSKFWKLVYQYVHEHNFLDWDMDHWYSDLADHLELPNEDGMYFHTIKYIRNKKLQEEIAQDVLEMCIDSLINQGYHVEHFYSPPNISVFKKFHFSILRRAYHEIRIQTDRQTDVRLDSEEIIPNINIPTNVDEEEVVSEEARQSPQADSPNSASLQESP